MSLGFTEARGFPIPAPPSPVTGTPSMTIKGSLEAFKEAAPRILMVAEDPGWPVAGVMRSPETLPSNIWSGETTAPRFTSSALMATTEPVISLFLTVP